MRSVARRVRFSSTPVVSLLVCLVFGLGCFCMGSDDEDESSESSHQSRRAEESNTEASSNGPSEGERREANVDAVWFQSATLKGGTSPVGVRVESTPGGKPAVAVMEQHVDGTGNSWQAAAWLAAINSSRITGHRLGDHEFVVKSGGFIDGPSAGMLITATMLALIRGESVRGDTTMTGTINPDGTAGPVGGIHQKMEGARESGKTRFGFPIGTRRSKNLKTGKTVDVVAYGEKLGLEVKEIKNVYDAYAFMTGKELPRARAARESDMMLGEAFEAETRQRIRRLFVQFEAITKEFTAQQKRSPKIVQKDAVQYLILAQSLLKEGQTLNKEGDLTLAYYRFRQASLMVRMATLQMRVNTFMLGGKYSAAINALRTERQAHDRRLKELKKDILNVANAGTIGGQINAINALKSVQIATIQMELADAYFKPLEPTLKTLLTTKNRAKKEKAVKELLVLLNLPLRYYALSRVQLEEASEQLKTGLKEGKPGKSSVKTVTELASVYTSAAGAGLYNIDALVVEGMAREKGITMEQAQELLARNDSNYAMARGATSYAKVLGDQLEKGSMEYALVDLASGVLAYNYAAELVNKYYALRLDATTQKVKKPRVLMLQLEQARIQAREAAGLALERLGFVPSSSRFYYQLASSLAVQSDDNDRLYALSLYWLSSFWSELAMALAE